ncbi:hypothetical protein AAE478_004817 [Parahypoxylon ruwenzoriense]
MLTSKLAAQAIRDYEFMTTASQNPLDPFVISAEQALDDDIVDFGMGQRRILMKDVCTKVTKETPHVPTLDEINASFKIFGEVTHTGPWEKPNGEKVNPAGGTRGANVKSMLKEAFWWRLGAAIIGAVSHDGIRALLGFIMAFFVEKVDQVFAGTLAYAAVLMVFVGVIMQEAS